MATNVLLPQWGMNMEDGLLAKWLVAEGDSVEAGQPLVEIETAKIESELESPVAGVVAHIMAAEGATANVGDILLVIGEPGESVERPASSRPAPPPRPARRERGAGAARGGRGQVTPVARRLAQQNNVNLDGVSGSGPNGRITEDDVRQAIQTRESSSARPAAQVVPKPSDGATASGSLRRWAAWNQTPLDCTMSMATSQRRVRTVTTTIARA